MIRRPQLAGFARGQLGAALPTQTLLPGASRAGLTPQQFTAAEQRALTTQTRAAASQFMAPLRTRAEMFGWDRRWAGDARWIDARMCLGPPVRPFDATCGGDPICNWGFYNVQTECSVQTFTDLLFQGGRYEWAQGALRTLLANKPGSWGRGGDGSRTTASAVEWTDWTLEVMRLVSLARWSTNVNQDYAPLGPQAQAKITELEALIPAPSKRHAGDLGFVQDNHLVSMWMPRNFNNIRRGKIDIPLHSAAFDPVPQYNFESAIHPGAAMGTGNTTSTWPWKWVPRSPGTDLRAQMIAWFQATLGSDMWRTNPSALVEYPTREGCGFDMAANAYCMKSAGVPFHWGTGNATILLAEAMARDVIDTPFGAIVADGLSRFLVAYEAIPEQYQVLGARDLSDIRDAVIELRNAEVMGAFGAAMGGVAALVNIVPVFGQIASAVILVATAVLGLLLVILQEAGAMAIGGGLLEAACLASPVIRMIPTPDVDGDLACDFDIRGERGMPAVNAAVNRLRAVRAAAAAELPVADWFTASKRANDGNVSELGVPFNDLPPAGGESSVPWLGLGVAGAVLLGGVLLLRK